MLYLRDKTLNRLITLSALMKDIRRITLTVTRRQTVRQQWLPVSAVCPACGCEVELQVEVPDAPNPGSDFPT